MKVFKHYAINGNTIALLYVPTLTYRTVILEPNNIYYCTKTPLQLIKAACYNGGADYDGRIKAMQKLLHTKTNLPVPINPTEGVFLFPSMTPHQRHCNWFSFFHIIDYRIWPEDKTKTEILFSDRRKKVIDTSIITMNRQYGLCGQAVAQLYKDVIWKILK